MTTVGFNFTKISAEKKTISEQNIRIENNVGITNIEEANVLDPKKSLIRFDFSFTCKYEPGLGVIELVGELIEMYDKELSTKIITEWKNEHKIHQDIMARILNNVLARANIEAIVVSRELGLPSPISMPKVEVKNDARPQPAAPSKPAEKAVESKPEAKKKK